MILKGNFEVKESKLKSVEVEGMANAMVKDRIGDIIPKEAWMLDEFKKNPVIFFNHESRDIVGKAIAVEATDEGLKMRVRLSNSKEGIVPYVRDLVKEGILKAFSVGFNDHGSSEKDADGTNVIKRAELLETSIVSVPMNQDSLFEVVSGGEKSAGGLAYTRKSVDKIDLSKAKSYDELKRHVLEHKGAYVAAAVSDAIAASENTEALLDFMAEHKDILAGEVLPVPAAFIEKASSLLNIEMASLKELNEPKEDDEEKGEKPEDDSDTEKQNDEDKPKEDDDNMGKSEDDKDPSDDKKDFQECVNSKVPKLLEEGVERDQAIAQAISMCETEGKCSATPEMIKEVIVSFNEKQTMDTDPSGVKEEFEQGQPSITLAKSQLALTGSLVELQKDMLTEMRKITDLLSAKQPEQAEEEPKEEPKAAEDMPPSEDEEDMEKMAQIAKDLKAIQESQRKLNKLLST